MSFFQKYLEEESSLVDGIVGFHDAIRKCEYCDESTVESRFCEPPGETRIGSKNRRVPELGGKITAFD